MMSYSTAPSLMMRPFVFKKAEWERRGTEILKVPETWSKIQVGEQYALVYCCPNCKGVSQLHPKIHKIDNLGKVEPSLQCPHKGCSFHRDCYFDEWNVKPLYACAVLEKGQPRVYYMHATTQLEARVELGPGDYQIVAIGRAIGFEVEDKHGEIGIARG